MPVFLGYCLMDQLYNHENHEFHSFLLGGLFIYLFFFSRQVLDFFGVPGSMLSCFSASLLLCFCFSCFSACLLLCFSAFLLPCFSAFLLFAFTSFCFSCFSAFHASLLYLLLFSSFLFFSASLLSLLLCFSAFLLLCFCAFLLLLFYLFLSFSHVFCCSTSCSSASLLPVFTTSLFFF